MRVELDLEELAVDANELVALSAPHSLFGLINREMVDRLRGMFPAVHAGPVYKSVIRNSYQLFISTINAPVVINAPPEIRLNHR
jgi:hypothetical protein